MDTQDGFGKVHFLIAAVFAVTVTLGSFAGVQALTSMNDAEMSEVTGQEGIIMDVEIGGSFNFEASWEDPNGAGPTSTGVVTMENIAPAGGASLNILGLTIDADGAVTLGSTGTTGGTASGAIVIGLPDIPNGIVVGAINPGGGSSGFDSDVTATQSIGKVGIGGVNNGSAVEVQIGANP